MYRLPLLLSVLLISLALPPNSFSDETGFDYNYGPGTLQLRSQSPTQSLRLTMPSIIPVAIKPGILSVNAGTTWTNVWVDSSKVMLDYEMLDTHIAVSYGINKRLGFGMAFDQRSYFGGGMDNFIQEFHDLFGIDQNGRDKVDRNLSRIIRYDDQGNIIFQTDDLSNMENNGVNLVAQSRKVDMFGRTIQPVTAILDPEMTVGLPPNLTAWTGIDALNHAFEAYIASYSSVFSDMIAEKAIELAVNNLHRVYHHPNDLEARGNMLIASSMAVMAASAGLGVVHSLAQTIGGYYNAPHGLAIATCFVPGIEYNLGVEQEKLARVSQIMGTDTSGMSLDESARSVIPALQNLLDDFDIPQGFDALGVREKDIPKLAEIAMLDGCTPTNPRPLDEHAFIELFQQGLAV